MSACPTWRRRVGCLAVVLAAAGCGGRPDAPADGSRRAVLRFATLRYQADGDVSMAAVPTARIAGERRPVLGAVRTVLGVHSLAPDGRRRVDVPVHVPPSLRGPRVALQAFTLEPDSTVVAVRPRTVDGGAGDVTLRVTVDRRPRGQPLTLAVFTSAPPESDLSTAPFEVPTGAALAFAVGIDAEEVPARHPAVAFRLAAVDDRAETVLFERRLDAAREPADRGWSEHEVDLSRFAGRRIRLRFTTVPARRDRRTPVAYPVWGDPTVLAPAPGAPRRRNVLLVSLDTLRADHLGCYGHARPTSPNIDRLAAEGVLFERAYAAYPSTSGSHMTLLTGLPPCLHGVTQIGLDDDDRLRPDALTLAELLRAAGYATGAFTENGWVTAASGFARGFQVFVENSSPQLGLPVGQAEASFGAALDFVRRHRTQPWFVFAHTYQVHAPYTPPPGYLDAVLAGNPPERTALLQPALYDAEIRYVDALLGRLLEDLRRLGVLDETIVVVVSDHGEQFGEHGLFGHGNSLHDVLLHVPLLVRAPGLVPAGKRIAHPVGLVDVSATVLALLGLPPSRWNTGRDLAPLIAGAQLPPRPVFAELPILHLVAARTAAGKWIFDTGRRTGRGFAPGDVRETAATKGASEADPAWNLVRTYEALCRSVPPPPPAPTTVRDPVVHEKLKALGYVN